MTTVDVVYFKSRGCTLVNNLVTHSLILIYFGKFLFGMNLIQKVCIKSSALITIINHDETLVGLLANLQKPQSFIKKIGRVNI